METRNIGFGFIFFNNVGNQLLKRTFQGNFRKIIKQVNKEMKYHKDDYIHVNHDDENLFGLTEINQWKQKQAPAASDIIWNKFCTKFSLYNYIFSILLILMLTIFVTVLVTPLSFLGNI